MPLVKKLSFAPIFLLVLALTFYLLSPILTSTNSILSLDLKVGIELIVISVSITLSSAAFIIFAGLAGDLRLILPVVLVSSSLPLIFLPLTLGFMTSISLIISLILSYLIVQEKVKNYVNFSPTAIFGPTINTLANLMIMVFCVAYFFASTAQIKQQGFELPDELIDSALKLSPQTQGMDLPPDLVKQTIKDQVNNIVKPYIGFIPVVLALVLFFTLKSLASLLSILVSPLLWLIFLILEKTGFISFVSEMREVKKLVV